MNDKKPQVSLNPNTYNELRARGQYGDTFDSIIKKLLDATKKRKVKKVVRLSIKKQKKDIETLRDGNQE